MLVTLNRPVVHFAAVALLLALAAPKSFGQALCAGDFAVATGESLQAGALLMGTYASTADADGVSQVIEEQDATIGPPPKRADLMKISWSFTAPTGTSHTFRIRASRTDAGNDGDDFALRYSSDAGESWNAMLTVATDSPTDLAFNFPTNVAGPLLIEASDTDRTARHKNHATLAIDAMCIEASSDPPPPPPPPSSARNVIGYYTSWSIYDRDYFVSEIPADKLTHINYAFANLEPDGTIVIGDEFADVGKAFGNEDPGVPYKGNFQQLNILKQQHPHIKTLISVGGWTWSDHFSDVAADAVKTAHFCQSGLDFVNQYGFDGMDIDWEYPGDPGEGDNSFRPGIDKFNYSLMLSECSGLFQEAGKLLTVATPCNPTLYNDELDLPGMIGSLDWVNLLSYDLHGAWDPVTAHQSQLYRNPGEPNPLILAVSQSECVEGHVAAGVPPEKIVLGQPVYGRSYARVNPTPGGTPASPGLFQPFDGVPKGTWDGGRWGTTGVFDYEDLVLNILPDALRTFDSAAGVPSLLWTLGRNKGDGFMSYDDPESICEKAQFIEQNDLLGFMFWELSGDIEDHPASLVEAMFCSVNPTKPECSGFCGP